MIKILIKYSIIVWLIVSAVSYVNKNVDVKSMMVNHSFAGSVTYNYYNKSIASIECSNYYASR